MVSGTNVQIWKIQNSTSGGVISYTLNILHGTTWTPYHDALEQNGFSIQLRAFFENTMSIVHVSLLDV